MKKIAIITPWPTQKSGIATFIYKLIPYLSNYFNIDVFYDNSNTNDKFVSNQYGNLYPIKRLDSLYRQYDELVYHMGNNYQFHEIIYNYIKRIPGIVELHDFDLSDFYKIYNRTYFQSSDNLDYLLRFAKKIIVHNQWAKKQVEQSKKKKTYVIPLPAFDLKFCDNITNKNDSIFYIGCFGYINMNKRPYIILEAVRRCLEKGKQIHVFFFGKSNISKFKEAIYQHNMQKYITVIENADNNEYSKGLATCDIFINLRYPTKGESSLTLTEELKIGKPVLVSAINQYLEFPDNVCWKVPLGQYEIETLVEMIIYLIEHKDVKLQLGKNAKNYADTILSCEKIARMYLNVL